MTPTTLSLSFLISALVSAGLAALVLGYARHHMLDIPNERSSHTIPTPRGGGLAIVITFSAGLCVLAVASAIAFDMLVALGGAGWAVALAGFADDKRHVPPGLRLSVQAGATLWAMFWLGGAPPLEIGDYVLQPGLIGGVIALICVVWLTNLYNFMDGIDGLAGSETAVVAGGGALLAWLGDAPAIAALLLILAGASSGFLVWNWPPARLFMGDVGSGFIGLTLGLLAILAAKEDVIPIWTWAILMSVFIVDATMTLFRRIACGADWMSAHRSHAYQRLARQTGSHGAVTITATAINLLWLLPLAYAAFRFPSWGFTLCLVAWTPLAIAAWRVGAGLDGSKVA